MRTEIVSKGERWLTADESSVPSSVHAGGRFRAARRRRKAPELSGPLLPGDSSLCTRPLRRPRKRSAGSCTWDIASKASRASGVYRRYTNINSIAAAQATAIKVQAHPDSRALALSRVFIRGSVWFWLVGFCLTIAFSSNWGPSGCSACNGSYRMSLQEPMTVEYRSLAMWTTYGCSTRWCWPNESSSSVRKASVERVLTEPSARAAWFLDHIARINRPNAAGSKCRTCWALVSAKLAQQRLLEIEARFAKACSQPTVEWRLCRSVRSNSRRP